MYTYRYIDQKQYYFMHINLLYKRKHRKKSVKYCIAELQPSGRPEAELLLKRHKQAVEYVFIIRREIKI